MHGYRMGQWAWSLRGGLNERQSGKETFAGSSPGDGYVPERRTLTRQSTAASPSLLGGVTPTAIILPTASLGPSAFGCMYVPM